MKKLLLALALFLASTFAHAACSGIFAAGSFCGSTAGGPPIEIPNASIIGALPLANGDIYVGNASNKAAAVAPSGSGDCTFTFSNLGVFGFTCLKTNGISFGSLATQSSVTSAQLPSPFTSGTASGNTNTFATTSGTLPNNHVAAFDSNGNIVDGGGAVGNVTAVGSPTIGQFGVWASGTQLSGIAIAAKADQQAGTSTLNAVTPSQAQSHDSASKAWVNFTGSSAAINGSYNVLSPINRTGTGVYVISFSPVAFANTNYVCDVQTFNPTIGTLTFVQTAVQATTSITVGAFNTSFSAADPNKVMMACFGRQ